jgi:hypothetical protein
MDRHQQNEQQPYPIVAIMGYCTGFKTGIPARLNNHEHNV